MFDFNRKRRSLLAASITLTLGLGSATDVLAAETSAAPDLASASRLSQLSNPSQQFIVKMNDVGGRSAGRAEVEAQLQSLARSAGYEIRYTRQLGTGAHLMTVSGKLDRQGADAVMRALGASPSVKYVEPNAMLTTQLTPNDPRFNEQWHYTSTGSGINAVDAWDFSSGAGVNVAIIDTGITDHSDINANVVGGYDFISSIDRARDGDGRDADPTDEGDWITSVADCDEPIAVGDSSWHGTHVSGTVAAQTNNGEGVAGVAYNATIVPVRALGKCGGTLADVSDALIWAAGGNVPGAPANAHPARIINMSLGKTEPCPQTMQDAMNAAVAQDALVVTAAGNSGGNVTTHYPANCTGAFRVAALDRTGNLADYSNFGTLIDVSAPGGDTIPVTANGVLSLSNTGATTPATQGFRFLQGTSMAAPHVAGVAALLLSADPSLTSAQLRTILRDTTRTQLGDCNEGPVDGQGTNECGTGMVDALAAINAVTTTPLVDTDGDGVDDSVDNCLDVPNSDQRDTNGDGYGNLCDPDLNNDLIVNVVDLGIMRDVFFTADADADLNGDGVVNVIDLGILQTFYFMEPGPSLVATPPVPTLTIVADDVQNGIAIDYDGDYLVQWSASIGAASYVVRKTSQTNPGNIEDFQVTGTTLSQENIPVPSEFLYQVQACNASGACSEFSEEREVIVIPPSSGGEQ